MGSFVVVVAAVEEGGGPREMRAGIVDATEIWTTETDIAMTEAENATGNAIGTGTGAMREISGHVVLPSDAQDHQHETSETEIAMGL